MENRYLMLIAAAILCLFLLFIEIKRANRDRLFFRILAVLLAVSGLVWMAFPWSYNIDGTSGTDELRLLTSGTKVKIAKDTTYFTLDSNVLKKYSTKQVTYIPNLAYYLAAHPQIHQVKADGYGLSAEELNFIKDYTYKFQSAPSPSGVITCSWPHDLKETGLLEVQGIYHNTTEQVVKLYLEGLGSRLDSILVKGNAEVHFSLKSSPKQLGRAVYTLIALHDKDTLAKEHIPFQVVKSPKIKLLILSSFPDFEYKFLKNWLYENKYQVVFKARVSKDKFSADQLNTTALSADKINIGTLSKFDLVIADDEELSKLDQGAISSFHSALSRGLGLLVRLNDVKPLSVFAEQFKFYIPADSSAKSLIPVLAEDGVPMKAISNSQPFYIQSRLTDKELIKDQTSRVLLSSQLYGIGKIGVSTISSTYHWILNGDQVDYTKYWSAVISSLVRRDQYISNWKTIPELPMAGHQTELIYESLKADSVPHLLINRTKIIPLRHTEISYRWKGTFWPEHAGWNELHTENNPPGYFFVFDRKDWAALKDRESILQNLARAKDLRPGDKSNTIQSEKIQKKVSKWWFFCLFLLAVAYLWFETKLL